MGPGERRSGSSASPADPDKLTSYASSSDSFTRPSQLPIFICSSLDPQIRGLMLTCTADSYITLQAYALCFDLLIA